MNWVVARKNIVIGSYSDAYRDIVQSSLVPDHESQSQAKWWNRASSAEDPNVWLKDSGDLLSTDINGNVLVYLGNSHDGSSNGLATSGAYVYIRNIRDSQNITFSNYHAQYFVRDPIKLSGLLSKAIDIVITNAHFFGHAATVTEALVLDLILGAVSRSPQKAPSIIIKGSGNGAPNSTKQPLGGVRPLGTAVRSIVHRLTVH